MNYSLGNMLSGGGALNPDGLELDLAFALDNTLTARKGPTPTFTRASAATFIGSNGLIQTAAINAPRFDYDPVTLVSKGLLIEEQRINSLLNSDTLSTQNVTVTASARTISFYGTGTIVLSGAHSATLVGTGAFPSRVSLTFTPTAGTLTVTVTGSVRYAQLESGSFASSYIPTTSSAVTRSADVCSIVGANFTSFYNQSEGTLLADVTPRTVDQLSLVVGINTSTFNNGHFIYKSNSLILASGRRWAGQTSLGAAAQSTISSLTDIAVSRSVLSYAYKVNDMAFAANGSIVGTDNTGVMPTSTAMRIGARDDGLQINGHLARVKYFSKRLPNSRLITITA